MDSHDASHDSLHVLNLVLQHLVRTAVVDLSLGTRVRDIMIVTTAVQGRRARKGDLVTRITVTLSIFNFSTRFSAQIVENRETQLSSPFLGPGDNFSKSYDENQICSERHGYVAAARGSDAQISGAIQLPYKSVFVITFRKIVPRT
jgi:hypothetical protein